ncbi:MAG: c-type cytochrome [Saprospiraceae bacterium]|nr:c-type cytochrome [Saprospiraceae bacterium]
MANTDYYFPVLWLVIAALVAGVFAATGDLALYRRKIESDPVLSGQFRSQLIFLQYIRGILRVLAILLAVLGAGAWYTHVSEEHRQVEAKRKQLTVPYDKSLIRTAPDPFLAETDPEARLIAYGRDLIVHTQDYFGENGLVRPHSINAMNCQNCHLDGGSKPFGNNYFAVASTYPQMRARSGALETIPKRVNDCFQRSLNGQPIDTTSREMLAILAYMRWLGTGIPKGEKPKGAGLVEVPFLNRPADPARGQAVFAVKCASCHGIDGQGLPMPESARSYPPLWGDNSYNEGAGLFRMSRFAGYVKANMPFGASYDNPQLTDEEAWDVAAFVNSRPRPKHPFLKTDWPNISKKPFDHPFGPYSDTFPEIQHKFGPYGPITAFYKK